MTGTNDDQAYTPHELMKELWRWDPDAWERIHATVRALLRGGAVPCPEEGCGHVLPDRDTYVAHVAAAHPRAAGT